MSKKEWISEKKFNNIKTLIEFGVKNKTVQEVFGISEASVSKVKMCNDYDAYRKKNAEYRNNKASNSKNRISSHDYDADIDEIKQDIKFIRKCIVYLLKRDGFHDFDWLSTMKEEDL